MTNTDICPMCHHMHCTNIDSPHRKLHYCQTPKGAKFSANRGKIVSSDDDAPMCGCLWNGERFVTSIEEFIRSMS